jgi:ABC-type multidrug transport system fused ATPase/permease subunit
VVFEGLDRGRIVVVDPSVAARWYLDESEARNLVSGIALAFEPADGFQPRSRMHLALDMLSPVLTLDRRTHVLVAIAAIALTGLTVLSGTEWLWSLVLGDPRQSLATASVLQRAAILAGVLTSCMVALVSVIDGSVGSQVSRNLARLAGAPKTDGRAQVVPPTSAYSGYYFVGIDPRASDSFPELSWIILLSSALIGAAFTSWSAGGSVTVLLAAFTAALVVSLIAAGLVSRAAARRRDWRVLITRIASCVHLLACLIIWGTALRTETWGTAFLTWVASPSDQRVIVPYVILAVASYRFGVVANRGSRWLTMYKQLWERLPNEPSRLPGSAPVTASPTVVGIGPSRRGPLLAVRNVTLRLGDKRDHVLSQLELELGEGEMVAVVGPAGAGKTTLAKALLGRFHAQPGAILLEGRSVHEYRQEERDRLVRGIAQGDWIPDSTISRILRADNGMTLSDVRALCEQLGFDEEFAGLPLGYDTPVHSDGDTLSRGQRQMLLLAQVVASGSRVLVLDDPVSSLDDAAARRVLEALATLRAAVVLATASESAVRDLDCRVIHLNQVASSAHAS